MGIYQKFVKLPLDTLKNYVPLLGLEIGAGFSHILTVATTSVLTKPVLCTKQPKITMLFYHIKVPACSSPQHSTLPLTEALKWGTVWACISTGIETMHGQS